MRRFVAVLSIGVAACIVSTTAATATKSDPAKTACISLADSYSLARNGSPPSSAAQTLSGFTQVHNKALTIFVNALRANDMNQTALDRVANWCATHYRKVKTLRNLQLVARTTTTTTLPPTTTTLGIQPQHYEGSGDSVVDVTTPIDDPAIAHIIGNSSSRFFAVTSYGPTNNRLDLLVNTTDPYDGLRPLSIAVGSTVAHFEVKASSAWSIDIAPLETARRVQSPGHIEGESDDVIVATGNPTRAHIVGNASARFFAVIG
jgi:hypothetical protein